MKKIPVMVSMELADEHKVDAERCAPIPCPRPDYPYGLQLSLDQTSLEKLKIDPATLEVGAMIHFHCLAKITNKSEHEREGSDKSCRVELQITNMSCESEDAENEDTKPRRTLAYRGK